MTSYIIFAFVSGFLLATVIFWIINRKQQKEWQAEYRRLMAGIERIKQKTIEVILFSKGVPESEKEKLRDIEDLLHKLYLG